ncbi:MAG: exodeoxyribonuclease VII large subunit [Lachnospiraceae bacterium]|nr:exodeoxyribonuclease VII large subunit [Lachnospiraceae bacterium]
MPEAIFTVGRVNAYIKSIFENDFALRQIAVRGEVSNCKYHTSGHIYFTLKDETGVLSAVMFRGSRPKGLRFQLQDGQQVIVRGSIMIYERDGRYQLYAREIVQDGLGDLHRRFEETKKKLEEMGMFAQEYKQKIPAHAATVGVVTASTGAAIRDIENVIGRRNPTVQVYLYPAQVQGEGAAASIVKGIETLDAMGLDVLIVGRGGGSIEDLWAFNEEAVARAIFDCSTPVISAVGHETDFTIADFVADLRAPTPSAAAELAVYDVRVFLSELASMQGRLSRSMRACVNEQRYLLEQQIRRLERGRPSYLVDEKRHSLMLMEEGLKARMRALADGRRQALSRMDDALRLWMRGLMDRKKAALGVAAATLEGYSPLRVLGAGFGSLTDASGRQVKSVTQVAVGDELGIRLADGKLKAEVTEIENGAEAQSITEVNNG